jgi:hypothetical protein
MDSEKQKKLNLFLASLRENKLINNSIHGEYSNYPYEHIRIFNLFEKDTYNHMCLIAEKLCSTVHSVDYMSKKYAKIKTMKAEDSINNGYSFFSSKELTSFISEIFDLQLTKFFSSACHLHNGTHEKESILGWPHTDLNVCQFKKGLDKSNHLNEMQYSDGFYTKTSMEYDPEKIECVVRSAAYLFYLNEKDNLSDSDGGGTHLYDSISNKFPIKTIPPINNSLFLFKISKESYHGVQPAKFDRYVNVNWVHSEPCQYVNSNLDDFKYSINQNVDFFENWDNQKKWNIEKSPKYNHFFKKPIKFLFKN